MQPGPPRFYPSLASSVCYLMKSLQPPIVSLPDGLNPGSLRIPPSRLLAAHARSRTVASVLPCPHPGSVGQSSTNVGLATHLLYVYEMEMCRFNLQLLNIGVLS